MREGPLRVAFLVGSDGVSTRESIAAVCELSGVLPVGILVDTHEPGRQARLKNLKRNLKREGVGYLPRRVLAFVRDLAEKQASKIVPKAEIEALLKKAYPERDFSLEDLGRRWNCPVIEAGNLNSSLAAEKLRLSGAQLGIVIGTRILKRSTFAVPELGSINLHKGKVPEYRGMPPGFWELYEGEKQAGVTVHYVDDGLDTGDVVGSREFDIDDKETLKSLRRKLDEAGTAELAASVKRLAEGTVQAHRQPSTVKHKTRTKPTAAEQEQLRQRRPGVDDTEADIWRIFKTAVHLGIYHLGIFALVRVLRRGGMGRGAIILHHRVNDRSDDNLTTNTRVFAEQLLVLRRFYQVRNTNEIVRRVRMRQSIEDGTVAIHFDDCYRDVYQLAAPLLKAASMPGMMFIATGFIDSERVFEHDSKKYPWRFENLRRQEVAGLQDYGVDVGAHTVNHVDLGSIPLEQAKRELTESKVVLEEILGRPVPLFSFPFGKETNIRPEVRTMVKEAGFYALFSAYGGYVSGVSDPYDIRRLGTNSRYGALDLIMELEALSVAHWARRLGCR